MCSLGEAVRSKANSLLIEELEIIENIEVYSSLLTIENSEGYAYLPIFCVLYFSLLLLINQIYKNALNGISTLVQ